MHVALSTSAVYPEPVTAAFEIAADLGYDGVELMVWNDPASQDLAGVQRMARTYRVPITSIHAPCLIITQRVWSKDPSTRLRIACQLAASVGAPTVVVHPPFIWQRDYALRFADLVALCDEDFGVTVSVENMYPWRVRQREVQAYLPGWDPGAADFDNLTLDVSHAAVAGQDCRALAAGWGSRLQHLHLTDGTGSARDDHLVPGRGGQPVAGLLRDLAASGYRGAVAVEVNTRSARGRSERRDDLRAALHFARTHTATPPAPSTPTP